MSKASPTGIQDICKEIKIKIRVWTPGLQWVTRLPTPPFSPSLGVKSQSLGQIVLLHHRETWRSSLLIPWRWKRSNANACFCHSYRTSLLVWKCSPTSTLRSKEKKKLAVRYKAWQLLCRILFAVLKIPIPHPCVRKRCLFFWTCNSKTNTGAELRAPAFASQSSFLGVGGYPVFCLLILMPHSPAMIFRACS